RRRRGLYLRDGDRTKRTKGAGTGSNNLCWTKSAKRGPGTRNKLDPVRLDCTSMMVKRFTVPANVNFVHAVPGGSRTILNVHHVNPVRGRKREESPKHHHRFRNGHYQENNSRDGRIGTIQGGIKEKRVGRIN
nr:hypothetical protein [Tanacetum cinerariifolium]